jgi:hypothetical protein
VKRGRHLFLVNTDRWNEQAVASSEPRSLGSGFGYLGSPYLLLMLGFGRLQFVEGSQQDAVSPASVVGYLPEPLVSAGSALLDVNNLGAVAENSPRELALRQLGGLAEGAEAVAKITPQSGYELWFACHVTHIPTPCPFGLLLTA